MKPSREGGGGGVVKGGGAGEGVVGVGGGVVGVGGGVVGAVGVLIVSRGGALRVSLMFLRHSCAARHSWRPGRRGDGRVVVASVRLDVSAGGLEGFRGGSLVRCGYAECARRVSGDG